MFKKYQLIMKNNWLICYFNTNLQIKILHTRFSNKMITTKQDHL